jgi:hypothetical protein
MDLELHFHRIVNLYFDLKTKMDLHLPTYFDPRTDLILTHISMI